MQVSAKIGSVQQGTVASHAVWGAVALALPGTQQLLMVNADTVLPTASVIKVAILVELYRQAPDNNLDLQMLQRVENRFRSGGSGILSSLSTRATVTVKDSAVLMMQLSDNTAANMLIDLLRRENINRTMSALGLQHTRLWVDRIDPDAVADNPEAMATTTPREMATLMTHLAMEDILTPSACREIVSLMKRDRNPRRIGGHLPMRPDITVHHKTGTLKGVYNDVGLVRFAGGQYVISVLSKGVVASDDPRRPNEADEFIATLSRWVFDQLDQKGNHCNGHT